MGPFLYVSAKKSPTEVGDLNILNQKLNNNNQFSLIA